MYEVWLMHGENKSVLQKVCNSEAEAIDFTAECERDCRRHLAWDWHFKYFEVEETDEERHNRLFNQVLEEMRQEKSAG